MILSQALHGLAYTFFIWAGFVYVERGRSTGHPWLRPSFVHGRAFRFGFFLGTQFTGIVMDKLKTPEGGFRWRQLFLVPGAMTMICLVMLAALSEGGSTSHGMARPIEPGPWSLTFFPNNQSRHASRPQQKRGS